MYDFNDKKTKSEDVYEVSPIERMAWSNGAITFCVFMVLSLFATAGIPPVWVWLTGFLCGCTIGFFTNTKEFFNILISMNCECEDEAVSSQSIDVGDNTRTVAFKPPQLNTTITKDSVDLFSSLDGLIERKGCDLKSILIRARDVNNIGGSFYPTRSMFNQLSYVKTSDYSDFIKIMDDSGMTTSGGRGTGRKFTTDFFNYAISECVSKGW